MPGAVFIEGERVELRTREREDAVFRRDHVNRPDLRPILGTKLPQNLVYEETAIEQTSTEENELRLIICTDDEPIGHITLWTTDRIVGEAEVGLWLIPDAQQNNYGTDALKLLTTYGFEQLNLHRITAEDVIESNNASQKMLSRLGFAKEGCHREAAFINGEYLDTYDYAILESEWN